LGTATRSPRRRRPHHFFRDLAFFGDSVFGLWGRDDGWTTDGRTKPGSPQTLFYEQKSPSFIACVNKYTSPFYPTPFEI
jgi:hypothetical protein